MRQDSHGAQTSKAATMVRLRIMMRSLLSRALPLCLCGMTTAANAISATLPTQSLSISVTDMVWDSSRSRFWATVGNAPLWANSIVLINPDSGAVEDSIAADSAPVHLTVSLDGQYLYVGFDGAGIVRRYHLPGHTSDQEIALGNDPTNFPYRANALAVLPGQPASVLVARATVNYQDTSADGSLVVYDDGKPRTVVAQGPAQALIVLPSGGILASGGGIMSSLNADATGVSITQSKPGFPIQRVRAFAGGRYITDDRGYVFDSSSGITIGLVALASGTRRCLTAMDPAGSSVLAASTDGLRRYSLSTFLPVASVDLDQSLKNTLEIDINSAVLRTWGSDGVLIQTASSLLFGHTASLASVADKPWPAPAVDSTGAIHLSLATNGLAYDPKRGLLYASVAGYAGSFGNTVMAIDAGTGTVRTTISVGSEPGALAITEDGSRLFAALSGAPLVVPVNLDASATEAAFPVLDSLPANLGSISTDFPYWTAEDMVCLPGAANAVAVLRAPPPVILRSSQSRSVAVYDGGVLRPAIATETVAADRILPGDSLDSLFALASAFGLWHLRIRSDGLAIDKQLNLIAGTSLEYSAGRLYSDQGTVWTPDTQTLIGSFLGYGEPVPFPDRNIVVYAFSGNTGLMGIWAFDTTTFRLLSSITLSKVISINGINRAFRTGPSSLAVQTDSEIILIPLSALQPQPDASADLLPVVPGVQKMNLSAWAIAPAPQPGKLLAATASVAGQYSNGILTVNPTTAAIESFGFVGSEPQIISVIPGSNKAYVWLAGESNITRVDLSSVSRSLVFAADPSGGGSQHSVFDIAASPDGGVAASFFDDSVAIFDDGVMRPKSDRNRDTFSQAGIYQLAYSSSGKMLYGYGYGDPNGAQCGGLKRWSSGTTGVKALTLANDLTSACYTEIRYAGGLLYSSIGDVIDPEKSRVVAQFVHPALQQPGAGFTLHKHVVVDPPSGRAYFIAGDPPQILVFDMYSYAFLGSMSIPVDFFVDGDITSLVKYGPDGLAILTGTGYVYLVQISAIPTLATPTPSPQVSLPVTPGVAVIDLSPSDLTYNAVTGLLYAALPNSEGALGDTVVAINPASGTVTAVFPGAVNSDQVRVSDDGSHLFQTTGYVNSGILAAGDGVRSIDPESGVASAEYAYLPVVCDGCPVVCDICILSTKLWDMTPLPGRPQSIATLYSEDGIRFVRVYDGAVPRPAFVPLPKNPQSSGFNCTSLQPGADASRLYCYNGGDSGFSFSRLSVDSSGVTLLDSSGPDLIGAFNATILFNQSRVYTTNGRVIDPEQMQLLGSVPLSGSVAVDGDTAYWLAADTSQAAPVMKLSAFDRNTLAPLETREINVSSTKVGASRPWMRTITTPLVPCGQGRLAFLAGKEIYIVYPSSAEPGRPSFTVGTVQNAASYFPT